MNEVDVRILLQIVVIVILAGALGWEREAARKSAGLRTHILIGISAMLFVVIGELMIEKFSTYGTLVRFNPADLVVAVVAGISFLGAGMIYFNKDQSRTKGLTTGAGMLTTAAIGMIVGLERYGLAVGATAIVFGVLHFVRRFEEKVPDAGEGND